MERGRRVHNEWKCSHKNLDRISYRFWALIGAGKPLQGFKQNGLNLLTQQRFI